MNFRALSAAAGPDALQGALQEWGGDCLALGLFSTPEPAADPRLGALLGGEAQSRSLLEQRRFKGKAGECLVIDRLGSTPGLLILVGLGEPAALDLSALRAASATAAKA
ncbi:MAG: M17 family peptidase N-terminal domain-containing protein, partial [Cyanobacteriota bacterium]